MIKLRIGVDATFSPNGGSLGHLLAFIEEFSKILPKADLILFVRKENLEILGEDIIRNCSLRIVKSASWGNLSRILWGQFILPISAKVNDIDVLFCPGNFSPIFKTTKIKSQWIATIGPFVEEVYSGLSLLEKVLMTINKYLILVSGKTSNIVIHESGFSKELFLRNYNFCPEEQFLIECGKDNFFEPNTDATGIVGDLASISSKDLLCVSHLYPYKNIERLLTAFNEYKLRSHDTAKLYIAGKAAFPGYYASIKALVVELDLGGDVFFCGMVSRDMLRFAYSSCRLFVFPSLCESSGYTLIEAMSCGSPVLASNTTAMPFTCGSAAEYFDAYDSNDLLLKMESLLLNDAKLEEMRRQSLSRASQMIDYEEATAQFLGIVDTVRHKLNGKGNSV